MLLLPSNKGVGAAWPSVSSESGAVVDFEAVIDFV
jgi:hypothetical protein